MSLDWPVLFTRFAVFFHSICRFLFTSDLPLFFLRRFAVFCHHCFTSSLSPVKFTGALEGWIPKLSVQMPFKLLPVSRRFICHDWSGAFAKQHRNSGLSAKLRWKLVAASCSRWSATLRKHLLGWRGCGRWRRVYECLEIIGSLRLHAHVICTGMHMTVQFSLFVFLPLFFFCHLRLGQALHHDSFMITKKQ